jgi:hypothetical protein
MFASAKPVVSQRLLLAHYLPWYEADPAHNQWGWHWTMQHFNPAHMVNGRRDAASKHYPLLGLYDSNDEDAIDCHIQLMKLAGIDGPIIDWYGTYDYLDYRLNNRNAQHMAQAVEKAGMKFAILYEDEVSMGQLVKDGKIPADQAASKAKDMMTWAQSTWFSSPNYVKLEGHPVLLSFGTRGYFQTDQWNDIFSSLPTRPALFTEYTPRSGAVGGFGWPAPDQDKADTMPHLDWNYNVAKSMPAFIAPAWPRFDDIYAEAGMHSSWGHIDDAGGKTYETTLTRALQSDSPLIQIATWNDWGEGTEIEPSVEYGYRDLEITQRLRRKYLDPKFPYKPEDLRLPVRLYNLRKAHAGDQATLAKLNAISDMLFAGKVDQARTALKAIPG